MLKHHVMRNLFLEECFRVVVESELVERHKPKAILRTNVDASTTEDALSPFFFVSLENRVNPAAQAARRLEPRLLFGEAGFHFGDAGPAVDGYDRHREPGVLIIVRGHLVVVEHRDDYMPCLRFPFRTSEITVDSFRGPLAIRNGTDYQTRPKGNVACGENPRRAGHEGFGVDLHRTLTRGFDSILWFEKRNIRGLAYRQDHCVAGNDGLCSRLEGRIETMLRVENRGAVDGLEPGQLSVLTHELLGSERRVDLDAFVQPFLDFF